MNSKRISLPQIPFEFGNFQKIDFTSFIEGENQDLLDFLNTMTKKKKNDCLYIWGSQGTGKTHLLQAACKQADDMNSQVTYIPLKQHEEFDSEILNDLGFEANHLSILYGGSVNDKNASDIARINNVDGFLIGTSSLDPKIFYKIYNSLKGE